MGDLIQTGRSTSSGDRGEQTNTVEPSAVLRMPPKAVRKPTPHRRRRGPSKKDPQTQLEIVQSALARLTEMEIEVYALETKCDGKSCLQVTIFKAGIEGERFVVR